MYPSSEHETLIAGHAEETRLTGSGELILLVDDEQIMRELGKEILEEHGYRVMLASDGVVAVDLFKTYAHDIDLVILDVLMPRLDGRQTYFELKRIDSSLKVFFCTGYAPHEAIGSLLVEDSLRALQKPFRPVEFLSTVRDVLSE